VHVCERDLQSFHTQQALVAVGVSVTAAHRREVHRTSQDLRHLSAHGLQNTHIHVRRTN